MINLIPKPFKIEEFERNCHLDSSFQISADVDDESIDFICDYFIAGVNDTTGLQLFVSTDNSASKKIILELKQDSSNEEAYELNISLNTIKISSTGRAGLFYGVVTLIQLNANYRGKIPCSKMYDKPRFKWRGMHLDVCRHFFTVREIKRYIDVLALHKMNIFHWHFVEDQGWRIEIKKYPRLNEVGAWRNVDGKKYGGFYSQEEIKEVIEYASQRCITIVPEIEMPGHVVSAVAAYPELSCREEQLEVETEWGIFEDVYCAGKESTFEFLENVLDEVIELFPGKYIHVGGDECPKTRWKECPKCQKRMTEEGLQNEEELQSYFIKRMARYIQAKGKFVIGWDEILQGGLAAGAAVMSWQGTAGGVKAARSGHPVVMSPTSHCYFDYYQAEKGEPKAFNSFLPLSKVYEFEPLPEELDEQESSYILGGQGNVWTEYMPNWKHVEYMLMPRICAMSEVLWSEAKSRDYDEFLQRLEMFLQMLNNKGYNYRKL